MRKSIFQIFYDFASSVALKLITGVNDFQTFGHVENLQAGVITDVSELATTSIPLPSNNGENIEIVSDNATDSDLIIVFAVGPNGVKIDPITVQLNGVTPVLIGNLSRINDARSIGVSGFNGTLTMQQQGGGLIFGIMSETSQKLNQCLYTVHNLSKSILKGLIVSMHKSGGGNTELVHDVLIKRFDQVKWSLIFTLGLQRDGSTSVQFDNAYPEQIEGPFDIKVQVLSSSAGAAATARINGLIFDN